MSFWVNVRAHEKGNYGILAILSAKKAQLTTTKFAVRAHGRYFQPNTVIYNFTDSTEGVREYDIVSTKNYVAYIKKVPRQRLVPNCKLETKLAPGHQENLGKRGRGRLITNEIARQHHPSASTLRCSNNIYYGSQVHSVEWGAVNRSAQGESIPAISGGPPEVVMESTENVLRSVSACAGMEGPCPRHI